MSGISDHVEDHEHVLAKVLVGDLDREATTVQSLVSSCLECRVRLEELITLAELMELEGQEGEELLASLDYDREVPGADLVAPFFEARVRELPDPIPAPAPGPVRAVERRRPLSWLRFAAAAAVLGGAGLWLLGDAFRGEPGPRDRVLLGTSHPTFQGAVGEVEEYAQVTWEASALSSADRYEITIFDMATGTEVFTETLARPQWTPTRAQQQSFPDAIHGLVVPLGVTGQAVGSTWEFWASRLP